MRVARVAGGYSVWINRKGRAMCNLPRLRQTLWGLLFLRPAAERKDQAPQRRFIVAPSVWGGGRRERQPRRRWRLRLGAVLASVVSLFCCLLDARPVLS